MPLTEKVLNNFVNIKIGNKVKIVIHYSVMLSIRFHLIINNNNKHQQQDNFLYFFTFFLLKSFIFLSSSV